MVSIKTDNGTYLESPKSISLPPSGGKYIDDLAEIEILRFTDERDRTKNEQGQIVGTGSLSTTYPVWSAFNKDSTKIWYFEHGGSYFVGSLNPTTLERVGTPIQVEPHRGRSVDYETMNWSRINPDLGFIVADAQIHSYKPSTNSYDLVADLTSLFPEGARFNQLYVSKDDNRFASIVRSSLGDYGFIVYDRISDQVKLNVRIGRINGITMDKTGKFVLFVPLDPEGQINQKIYDVETGHVEELRSDKVSGLPDFCIGHNDCGTDFVAGGDGWRGAVTVRKMSTPHEVTMAWQYAYFGWIAGWHISMRSSNEYWALMSSFGGSIRYNPETERTEEFTDGPFVREIWQIGVKDPYIGKVRRLIHNRANWGGNYWQSPRCSENGDGTLLCWTGNNNGDPSGRSDIFVARIPPAPIPSSPIVEPPIQLPPVQPPPTQPIVKPPRTVPWPSSEAAQDKVLEEQWKDRYRFKRNLRGSKAEFEHVP